MQGTEHHVPGEGGVDCDFSGFQVPDLTHHYDVGRLAQHGPEGGRESHPHVTANLHLVDTAQFVFDGILHRDDLAVRLVDVVESLIKGGRLARPGGAGDEEYAVRKTDHALEDLLVVAEEAQFGQA